jgi:hypothetical protein
MSYRINYLEIPTHFTGVIKKQTFRTKREAEEYVRMLQPGFRVEIVLQKSARQIAYESCGMRKVKGDLGGTYYE